MLSWPQVVPDLDAIAAVRSRDSRTPTRGAAGWRVVELLAADLRAENAVRNKLNRGGS